jgi:hypothetical protein
VTADDLARGLIIGGTGFYGLLWYWPESGRLFGRTDHWQRAPRWLRAATQRRDVGVHFYGLLLQVWALSVLATGIAVAAGARPSAAFLQGELGAIMAPAVVSSAIWLSQKWSKR